MPTFTLPPSEEASSVQDWQRLRAIVLRQERQLDLQLKQVAEGKASVQALEQQREQLRAFRELCDALLHPALQEQAHAGMHASIVPSPSHRAAGMPIMESSHARLPAKRAEHTILVVDDHAPTLYAAARLLKHAGYGVLEAMTGAEAMLLSTRASALLLDVNLPDINGVAVCQAVKQSSFKPVILMSAVFTDELHEMAGLGAGADRYLMSPLDGEQLASSFDQLLGSPA
jgi:CheY-like chemotaxis protein